MLHQAGGIASHSVKGVGGAEDDILDTEGDSAVCCFETYSVLC